MLKIVVLVLFLFISSLSYAESHLSPVQTVKRFYELIQIKDDASIHEAFGLLSEKYTILSHDSFHHIAKGYNKEMKIKIVKSKVLKKYAIVDVECILPSEHGGTFNLKTTVKLVLENDVWKIKLDEDTSTDI